MMMGELIEGRAMVAGDDERKDDERLLARAEEALTEIKVSTGLSEPHAAVLAALRIRLRGDPGGNASRLSLRRQRALDRDGVAAAAERRE